MFVGIFLPNLTMVELYPRTVHWKCTSKHWSPCPWQIRCCNRAGSVPSFVMLRSLIRQWLITAGSIKWNKPDNIRKTRKTWNKWKEHMENHENKQHQSKGHGGEQKNNSRHIKTNNKTYFFLMGYRPMDFPVLTIDGYSISSLLLSTYTDRCTYIQLSIYILYKCIYISTIF